MEMYGLGSFHLFIFICVGKLAGPPGSLSLVTRNRDIIAKAFLLTQIPGTDTISLELPSLTFVLLCNKLP